MPHTLQLPGSESDFAEWQPVTVEYQTPFDLAAPLSTRPVDLSTTDEYSQLSPTSKTGTRADPLSVTRRINSPSDRIMEDLTLNSARAVEPSNVKAWLSAKYANGEVLWENRTEEKYAKYETKCQTEANKKVTELSFGRHAPSRWKDLQRNKEALRTSCSRSLPETDRDVVSEKFERMMAEQERVIVFGSTLAKSLQFTPDPFLKEFDNLGKSLSLHESEEAKKALSLLCNEHLPDLTRVLEIDRDCNRGRFYESVLAQTVDWDGVNSTEPVNLFKHVAADRRSGDVEPMSNSEQWSSSPAVPPLGSQTRERVPLESPHLRLAYHSTRSNDEDEPYRKLTEHRIALLRTLAHDWSERDTISVISGSERKPKTIAEKASGMWTKFTSHLKPGRIQFEPSRSGAGEDDCYEEESLGDDDSVRMLILGP